MLFYRAGVTKQAEDGAVPGDTHIAYVRTPVPRNLTLGVGAARPVLARILGHISKVPPGLA